MLPTFIIAGAMKSGSSSLWMHMKEHPQVCMTPYRGTRYFTREIGYADGGGDPSGPLLSGHYHRGLDWYKSLFSTCREVVSQNEENVAVGEITNAYLSASDAPQLIYQTIPNVKLIFILRDPVDRLYSHYWEERKGGWELPNFEEFVSKRHPRLLYHINVSSYHLHLSRYLSVFPRDQIAVFLYDDLRDDPVGLIRLVYQAVGVNPNYIPSALETRYNPSGIAKIPRLQRMLNHPRVMRASMTLPGWLYRWLGKLRQQLVALNKEPIHYPAMSPALRAAFVHEFSDTIDYVERHLERPLPSWRAVMRSSSLNHF